MRAIQRKFIDWKKTGKILQLLREDNLELRRAVCGALRRDKGECSGNCSDCIIDIDNHISRKELSEVFGVSESVIFNWESGRTVVDYENLLFYAQLAKTDVNDIVIFMD
ncbi:MAG: helix-turn-helix transcriptional regulator [Clostridiales bacterium]|nr:helix-turn-helix transcriptional regulator [Clostridiales bacterium]